MSTLLRLPFALLTTLAMLLLWSGVASAESDESASLPLEALCQADGAPEACADDASSTPPTPTEGGTTEEGTTGGDTTGGDTTGGDTTGGDTTGHTTGADTTDTVVPAFPSASADQLGDTAPGDDTSGSGPAGSETTEDSAGSEGGSPAPMPGEEDLQEALECLAGVGEELVADLVLLLEESVGGLVLDIEGELTSIENPADLLALVQPGGGLTELLAGLGEDTVAQILFEGQLLLEMSAADVEACLEFPAGEEPAEEEPEPVVVVPVAQPGVHYANCDDARAKGAAPVHADQPGYGAHLDSDNDGVGCEDDVTPVGHAGPQLAYTGFDVWPFAGAGAALLVLGSTLVAAARRRS